LEPRKLRELAAWYRKYAERAGNPDIWDSRMRYAENLEAQADLIDGNQTRNPRLPFPDRANGD
jgi:hypothetical protein